MPVSNVKRSRCRARAVTIWGVETCSVAEQAPTSSTYFFVHPCTDVVPDDCINRSFVSSKCEREAGSRFNVKLVATCQFVCLPRITPPCLKLEQPRVYLSLASRTRGRQYVARSGSDRVPGTSGRRGMLASPSTTLRPPWGRSTWPTGRTAANPATRLKRPES
jgi:hypothetical protein